MNVTTQYHPGQSVRVIRQRTVLDRRGVRRLIQPGDKFVVGSHEPGGILVNCIQGGPATCVLQVPVECVVPVPEGDGGMPSAAVEVGSVAKAA